jgi:hypothetical protein
MKIEYKMLLLNLLYGFMEGNTETLEDYIHKNLKMKYNKQFDKVSVTLKDVTLIDNPPSSLARMTAYIEIDGESYSHTRDFYKEHDLGEDGSSIMWKIAIDQLSSLNN